MISLYVNSVTNFEKNNLLAKTLLPELYTKFLVKKVDLDSNLYK